MSNVYKEYVPPASDGGLYHKFEDSVTYTMRIASEPVVFQTEFTAPNGESNLSTKYGWVVYNVNEKAAQVMQLPVTAYRQIAALASDDEYGDPKQYNLKITRTGKGIETKYAVIGSPRRTKLSELDDDAEAKVAKVDLIDAITSGKGVSHVNWLKDALNDTKAPLGPKATLSPDTYVPDDESPIDLGSIPF